MQKVREKVVVFELWPAQSKLTDFFRFRPGTGDYRYWQGRNYDIIAFYWRFDKWGA